MVRPRSQVAECVWGCYPPRTVARDSRVGAGSARIRGTMYCDGPESAVSKKYSTVTWRSVIGLVNVFLTDMIDPRDHCSDVAAIFESLDRWITFKLRALRCNVTVET